MRLRKHFFPNFYVIINFQKYHQFVLVTSKVFPWCRLTSQVMITDNKITVSEELINQMIKNLEMGLDVMNNVDYVNHQKPIEQYPSYAIGYSRSAIQDVIKTLNQIKTFN